MVSSSGIAPSVSFSSYILEGIESGFRIGYNYSARRRSASHNLLSSIEHPEVIHSYLLKEQENGRIVGPLDSSSCPPVHCSPFGVIPKKGKGTWRMIIDLSSMSINDGIDETWSSLSYVTVDMAAAKIWQLGPGTLMAKSDIGSAFRLIPVHPSDWPLLAVEWEGNRFIDMVLPFGLRSAPKIFSAVADALQYIVLDLGVKHVTHYLDDFLFLGAPKSSECWDALQTFREACAQMGIPIAEEKTEGPSTTLEFLGVILDSGNMQMRLPDRKLQALKAELEVWLGRKVATKRELQSLAGSLQHAARVVKPGKCFTRRVHELSAVRHKPYHKVRLNRDFRSDIVWWSVFLDQWNGVSLLWQAEDTIPDIQVFSDAAGSWGCGALSQESFFQHQWPTSMVGYSIAHKELPLSGVISGQGKSFSLCAIIREWWRYFMLSTHEMKNSCISSDA